jgi:outer membrane receptor protein involved in Fe transport
MRQYFRRASVATRAASVYLFILAFAQPAFAQPFAAGLAGSVAATDGTPVSGARVTLVAQNRSFGATSDASGRFSLSNVPPGTYSVFASAPGYAPLSERSITIVPGTAATLALVLSRATTDSLSVIGQVRSSAGDSVSTSSAPVVNVNAQAAAAQGVTAVSDTLWSQLATTPVLPLGGGSNATVAFAVRGPDPTETLVDIDGHKVNNGNTGDFDLSLLDPAALQDVQVIYGISPSSLIGPNTIGGGINILTLEPTSTPHAFLRGFGGSFGSFGETIQATGSAARFGYAFSLHRATSSGQVNQSVLAGPNAAPPPSDTQTVQNVGSGYFGESMLAKLRYQLGGSNGYGYLQLDYRGAVVNKDESALLTNYWPPGYGGGGGGDAVRAPGTAMLPRDAGTNGDGGYQSFSGTGLATIQGNYGFDAQIPLGAQTVNGTPANLLQFSHLTTLASQTVSGPGAQTLPYMYDQRDLLGDDWLAFDHHFAKGVLSFKYDLGTEALTTDYVQGQVTADSVYRPGSPLPFAAAAAGAPPVQVLSLSQTQRSAVLRYDGDPTNHIHVSLAGYLSNFSTFGSSFDPRGGIVWTPTGNTAVRASLGTTFQTPQLSELVVTPADARVPIGGIVYTGNPNLQPDRATEYDLGAEQIFGRDGRQLHLTVDLYQNNLRSPSTQLNVDPGGPHCGEPKHKACPVSYPVNAGNGVYRGVSLTAEKLFGPTFRLRAGWDVDSSYLTVIPANVQDGTLLAGEQTLGQPLHKAYLGFENGVRRGLAYGAQLDYEGTYNELNRSPYATLEAHLAYRASGYEIGLYGTNLTNAYDDPFTVQGAGVPYGTVAGNPTVLTPAYVLQGRKVLLVVTRSF